MRGSQSELLDTLMWVAGRLTKRRREAEVGGRRVNEDLEN